jgi:hypothetical protein
VFLVPLSPIFVKKGRFWRSFLLILKKKEKGLFLVPLFLKKGRFWYCFLLIFKKGERVVFGAAFFEKAAL